MLVAWGKAEARSSSAMPTVILNSRGGKSDSQSITPEIGVTATNLNLVKMNTEIKQNTLDGSSVAGDIGSYSNLGSW